VRYIAVIIVDAVKSAMDDTTQLRKLTAHVKAAG